jgi:hypothetical protein
MEFMPEASQWGLCWQSFLVLLLSLMVSVIGHYQTA